jgi:hypothetical protein
MTPGLLALLLIGVVLAQALGGMHFLAPYKKQILLTHWREIGLFIGALWVNVTVALVVVFRRFRLRDTGRRMSYVEREMQGRF